MKKFIVVICILLSVSILFSFSVSAASDFYYSETYWKSCFYNSTGSAYLAYSNRSIVSIGFSDIDNTFVIPNANNTGGESKRLIARYFYSMSGTAFGMFKFGLPVYFSGESFSCSLVFVSVPLNQQSNVPSKEEPWKDMVYTIESRLFRGDVYWQQSGLINGVDYTISSPFYLNTGYVDEYGNFYPGYNYSAIVVNIDYTIPKNSDSNINDLYLGALYFHFTSKDSANGQAYYPDAFDSLWCGVFIDPNSQIGVGDQEIISGIGDLGSDLKDFTSISEQHLKDVQNSIDDLNNSLVTPDPDNQVSKDEQKEEFDNISDELGQIGEVLGGVEKPDPSVTVPDISDITSDIEIYNGDVISMLFLPIYDSKFIHWIFASVCSFALVGYILFGKRV